MKLEDFYKDIILSFGLEEEDGYIKAGGEKVLIKDRPLVLPTKHHLDTAIDNGVAVKYVFNILAENVTSVRLDLQYILKVMKVNLNVAIGQFLSSILEKFYSDLDDLSADMIELLNKANKAKGNARKLVDDNTLEILKKLLEKPSFVDLKLVRSVKIKDEKLKFGIKVKSHLYEYLQSEEAESDKLWKRRKDRDLFKILLEFLIGEILDTVIGSNHNKAPDALAVLKFNLNASEYFKSLSEDLDIENIYPECHYSAKQLSESIINKYIAKAHLIIDSEEFLHRSRKTTNTKQESSTATKKSRFGTVDINEGTYSEPEYEPREDNIRPNVNTNTNEETYVNRPLNNPDIVYGNRGNIAPRMGYRGYRDPYATRGIVPRGSVPYGYEPPMYHTRGYQEQYPPRGGGYNPYYGRGMSRGYQPPYEQNPYYPNPITNIDDDARPI